MNQKPDCHASRNQEQIREHGHELGSRRVANTTGTEDNVVEGRNIANRALVRAAAMRLKKRIMLNGHGTVFFN